MSRADDLAAAGRRRGARPADRRRPGAARRLHATLRPTSSGCAGSPGRARVPRRRRGARLHHRLPLHRARGRARGRTRSWSVQRTERELLPARGEALRRAGSASRTRKISVRNLASSSRRSATTSSWSRPGGWSRSCAGQGRRGGRARSPPPPRSTDEVYEWICEQGLSGRTEREVAAAMPSSGCASSAPSRRFRRSSPPAPNGALPHARASATGDRRGRAGRRSTWARSSTATARTAPGPSRPASSTTSAARGLRARPRARRQAALDAVAAGRHGQGRRRGVARADRRRRARRALRPRARPRGRDRGPRGARR